MDKWIKHQLLATSDQNLIAFLSFLIPPCHFYFFLVSLLGGQEVIQICLLGCLKVQFVPGWWHLSVQRCRLLHPSIPGTPACSVEASEQPGSQGWGPQIKLSFLSQAWPRQPVPKDSQFQENISILTKPTRQLFYEYIESHFYIRKKNGKIIL